MNNTGSKNQDISLHDLTVTKREINGSEEGSRIKTADLLPSLLPSELKVSFKQ